MLQERADAMTMLADEGFLELGPTRLEYRMLGPRPQEAPTLVLLHEGLGSVAQWGDFPARLAHATGVGVFAYSRAGYGRSSPAMLPRSVRFMHEEAQELRRVLEAIGFRRGLLVGHSDGASIAAIYAGSIEDHRVRGLVLMAPHFVMEECSLVEVARARAEYERGELRMRLARWHDNVDNAFYSWNGPWSDAGFRRWSITEELSYIRVPILIVQGEQDPCGTVRQAEVAREECYCPVEVTLLPETRHVPHREAQEATLAAVAGFVNRLLRDHHEGDLAAHAAAGVTALLDEMAGTDPAIAPSQQKGW